MTTEPNSAETKPKRRRFAISLRTMMILVLIVGGGIGWKVSRATKQRRALAALKQADAWVRFDHNYVNGKDMPNGKPWAPEWLRKQVGDEYFQEITCVSFAISRNPLKDSDLACLEGLDRLEDLDLSRLDSWISEPDGQEITDAGLVFLERLPRLKTLNLSNTRITDNGLAKLAQMTGIEELNLEATRVTVAGLASLKILKSLRKLGLNGSAGTDQGLAQAVELTQITSLTINGFFVRQKLTIEPPRPGDPPLPPSPFESSLFGNPIKRPDYELIGPATIPNTSWELLRKLPNLREIQISQSIITDENLAQFQKLPGLRSLKITNTSRISNTSTEFNTSRITNVGLGHIAAMTELETLWLENANYQPTQAITDAGLGQFKNLNKLRELKLIGKEYTDRGLSFLRAMPDLRVLVLDCKQMTDISLSYLQGLNRLEELQIINGQITDGGLVHLRQLTNLRQLLLMWTQVSNQGFKNLQAALPSLISAHSKGSMPIIVPQSGPDDDKKADEEAPPLPPSTFGYRHSAVPLDLALFLSFCTRTESRVWPSSLV